MLLVSEQETLNARSEYSNSEDDGTAQHRINQYLIKQEIGRGSFGAVHLAVDQYGQEYVRNPTGIENTTESCLQKNLFSMYAWGLIVGDGFFFLCVGAEVTLC